MQPDMPAWHFGCPVYRAFLLVGPERLRLCWLLLNLVGGTRSRLPTCHATDQ